MPPIKSFKLQEFVAHSSNVNCLQFGRKSGQVMVTGGEDRNVNMWRVGKPNNILCLSGHQSPVECVVFDNKEEKVFAGSQGGSLKCYDLQEGKVFRTLSGHMSNCCAVDSHPFGQFIASGSLDTNLKIWDTRSKMCIQTYKGHSKEVSTVKFSPDGRWVASGGKDGAVKLWDLTAGKLLKDFADHSGGIASIGFNPSEFILSTTSMDKTIKVYDIEDFELIATTLPDVNKIRSLNYTADGQFILAGSQDTLKMWSFDPKVACVDTIDVGWGRVVDTVVCESGGSNQLVGGSFQSSFVNLFVVDLSMTKPLYNGPALPTTTPRKVEKTPRQQSTPREPTPRAPVKEDKQYTSTDPVMEQADISQIRIATIPPTLDIQPPNSVRGAASPPPPTGVAKHTHRPNSSSGRKGSPAKPTFEPPTVSPPKFEVISAESKDEKPKSLDFSQFIPEPESSKLLTPDQLIVELNQGRTTFTKALSKRFDAISLLVRYWEDADIKGCIKHMTAMQVRVRQMTALDFLRSVDWQNDIFNLECGVLLFPLVIELLSSDFEAYILTGLQSSLKLVSCFSQIVKTTRAYAQATPGRNMDISLEDRLERCNACYEQFQNLDTAIQSLQATNKHRQLTQPIEDLQQMLCIFFQ